ncbi:unnamed protein product [Allacma fusca]|uniref:MARVEL domain-containing protein n=1 Tax=Allacma fusca TaxID=39272 RepID=A0A8J2NNK5_9HEXA|nr:unnamed protein product [Allacma fusca]
MARIGIPPAVSIRPIPTNANVVQMMPCPSNIISSPASIRYNNRGTLRGNRGGISCGKWQCCPCLHVDFIRRTPGILKIFEALIGVICQFLLLMYGAKHSQVLGESFTLFLISISSCLITTILLLGCYLVSRNTYHLIRSSIFEVAFNIVASLLIMTSSSYLAYAVSTRLYDDYTRIAFFQVYPALCAAYILGFVGGVLHGADAFCAYRYSQGLS